MSLVAEVTMQINVTRMSLKCTINVVIPLPLMSLNPMEIPRQFAIIYSEALKRMKRGKAMGPDGIPIKVWRCLRDRAIVWLTKF